MSALLELAVKCERLAGPYRALDAAIAAYVQPHLFPTAREARHYGRLPRVNNADLMFFRTCGISMFTASVDAALTLVPEGWDYLINSRALSAQVWERKPINEPFVQTSSIAETMPLALCAAALRARAASVDTHPKDGDGEATAPLVSGAVLSDSEADAQTQSPQSEDHNDRNPA